MRLFVALAVTALAMSGCEQGRQPEQAKQIKVANPYHDRLSALNGENQRLYLTINIRDNGKRCRRVEAARYQEDYRGMTMWVALCDDGRHWAIFIAPNGDTQVRDCREAPQLRTPVCRPVTPMPDNPNANITTNVSG